MLPPDIVHPVTSPAAARGLDAVADPRQQVFQRALAGQLGKPQHGEVLARLDDGSYVVRIAGTAARMLLPTGTATGAQVPLTLVALHPRPTFQIGAGGQPGLAYAEAGPHQPGLAAYAGPALAYLEGGAAPRLAPARAAALLARAQPDAPGAGGSAADSNPASLSAAGKAIGGMLAAASQAGPAPTALAGVAPLLPGPAADGASIARALHDAVGKSGLFYESHVAEWAHGKRSLAELAAEPQMTGARDAAASRGRDDPATAQFINLQLASQEQAHVAWQGQLWPGQHLEWQIDKEAQREQAHGEADEPAWQSRLKLRFPLLGELAASVALSGGRLHIRVDSGNDAATALLRAHAERLTAALEAAGTPLASLAIGTAGVTDE
jgi:hypothetical protein